MNYWNTSILYYFLKLELLVSKCIFFLCCMFNLQWVKVSSSCGHTSDNCTQNRGRQTFCADYTGSLCAFTSRLKIEWSTQSPQLHILSQTIFSITATQSHGYRTSSILTRWKNVTCWITNINSLPANALENSHQDSIIHEVISFPQLLCQLRTKSMGEITKSISKFTKYITSALQDLFIFCSALPLA